MVKVKKTKEEKEKEKKKKKQQQLIKRKEQYKDKPVCRLLKRMDGRRIGTMAECVAKNQIGIYGLKPIEMIGMPSTYKTNDKVVTFKNENDNDWLFFEYDNDKTTSVAKSKFINQLINGTTSIYTPPKPRKQKK